MQPGAFDDINAFPGEMVEFDLEDHLDTHQRRKIHVGPVAAVDSGGIKPLRTPKRV